MVLKVVCGTHLFSLPVASLFPGYVNKTANIHYFLYLASDAIYVFKWLLHDTFAIPITSRNIQPPPSSDSLLFSLEISREVT